MIFFHLIEEVIRLGERTFPSLPNPVLPFEPEHNFDVSWTVEGKKLWKVKSVHSKGNVCEREKGFVCHHELS